MLSVQLCTVPASPPLRGPPQEGKSSLGHEWSPKKPSKQSPGNKAPAIYHWLNFDQNIIKSFPVCQQPDDLVLELLCHEGETRSPCYFPGAGAKIRAR